MSLPRKNKTYPTIEEATAACGPKETVFHVTDPEVTGRDCYVVAKTHPLARAAAALAWDVTCSSASGKRSAPLTRDTLAARAATMTPEEREEWARMLLALNGSNGLPEVGKDSSDKKASKRKKN